MSAAVLPLAQLRCLLHPAREAAALCMQCGLPHCRECVTEHGGRVLCARCLRALDAGPAAAVSGAWRAWLSQAASLGLGLLLSWMLFFFVGKILLAIPSQFHEGSFRQRVMGQLDE